MSLEIARSTASNRAGCHELTSGTTSLFDRFRTLARELRTANGANVTITFALATIPMVGFVGAAVDYSHANSVKAAMQARGRLAPR